MSRAGCDHIWRLSYQAVDGIPPMSHVAISFSDLSDSVPDRLGVTSSHLGGTSARSRATTCFVIASTRWGISKGVIPGNPVADGSPSGHAVGVLASDVVSVLLRAGTRLARDTCGMSSSDD
jgi:hypothetical protein